MVRCRILTYDPLIASLDTLPLSYKTLMRPCQEGGGGGGGGPRHLSEFKRSLVDALSMFHVAVGN